MALNIRNSETEQLAQELAELTGETKTEVVKQALLLRLQQVRQRQGSYRLADELEEIAVHCSSLPVLDDRNADEILYDSIGLPK